MDFHKFAESSNELSFGDNNIAVIDVSGKKICVTNQSGSWQGFAYKCPHASGVMANGYIDAMGNAVCPLHRFKFSLKTGRCNEGYFLKTYPIEEREDGLYVGIKTSIFGF
ncbi:MAG: Rieske 2Fe-2S domain-containing protein [Flavitalea sp.]